MGNERERIRVDGVEETSVVLEWDGKTVLLYAESDIGYPDYAFVNEQGIDRLIDVLTRFRDQIRAAPG